jgi:SpoVK/Ycf46/Vps4 family AAA+-type ATPase
MFEDREDHRNPRARRRPESRSPVGTLVDPDPRHALDRLVLHPAVRQDIAAALRAVLLRDEMERIWKLSLVRSQSGRCIINFFGPPGTGKTRAALGVAWQLGKPLYQVDYSAIVSKYLGDTAKHIVQAFREAADADAVLFFDEADSLVSRRVSTGESCSTSINQNRNTLMQELDRFEGVVIMTTNLFQNYDDAILRRIARHVEFALPTTPMREAILRSHLPASERVFADLNTVAAAAHGLSGGDLLNVCVNSMEAASTGSNPDQWRLTEDILLAEVRKVRNSKSRHSQVTVGLN